MAEFDPDTRPLSPHLQIYRPQMTSISSILNRITGNALIVAALLVVWWLLAASVSAEYFAFADSVITSVPGDLVMVLSLVGLWYHLLGGIRHLLWDSGRALDVPVAERLGWGMIAGSVVLSLLTVIIV